VSEERFRSRLFGASEEKSVAPSPRSDEPKEFDWKVSREDSPRGPIVVLELVNREDDNDATRLGLEPSMAKEIGRALTANADV
jgi:hypothetical protein